METILGLIMIYVWVHSVVIVGKKIRSTTQYENAVLVAALVFIALYIIGTV